MRFLRRTRACAALAAFALACAMQAQDADRDRASISAMMQKSAEDWNRGDLDAFATSYKNSSEIEFIGPEIRHGYTQMLEGYRRNYPTREKMGTLSFSRLDTHLLDAHFATVTGWFHLERSAAGGGDADGYFLLVVEKTPAGWRIVRDDTTAHAPTSK